MVKNDRFVLEGKLNRNGPLANVIGEKGTGGGDGGTEDLPFKLPFPDIKTTLFFLFLLGTD